jgi:transposase
MGRALAAQGHEVRLMSPEHVRPYVKAQKNDDQDAEASGDAAHDALCGAQERGAA